MFEVFKKGDRVKIAPSFNDIDYEAIRKESEALMTERSIKRQLEDQLLAYLYGEDVIAQTRAVEGRPVVGRGFWEKDEYPLAKSITTDFGQTVYGFPNKRAYSILINKLYSSYIETMKD